MPEGLFYVSKRESFDAFLQAKQRAANPSSPSRRSKALGLLSGAPGSSRLNERPSNSLPRISSSPRPKRRKLERDPGLPTPSPSASSQVLDDTAPDNGRNEGGRARSVQTVSSGNDDEYDDQESEAESDAYTDDGLKAGEYVVERLLARSREQARPLQASPAGGKRKRVGKLEWWYLVRWAGYAPSDDTWEPESTLKRGAKKALKLFDAKRERAVRLRGEDEADSDPEHPFQIIGRRGEHETKTQYLVAYGEPGSSPLLEQVWQARRLVGKDHGLQQSVVDAALRDYGRTCSGARTCDWVKQGKGCKLGLSRTRDRADRDRSDDDRGGGQRLVSAKVQQQGQGARLPRQSVEPPRRQRRSSMVDAAAAPYRFRPGRRVGGFGPIQGRAGQASRGRSQRRH